MSDTFLKTKIRPQEYGGDWLPTFQYVDDQAIPMALFELPDDLFPDGFPCINRHWVKIEKADGNTRWVVIPCTAEDESTGGKCLVCYYKEKNAIVADHGRKTLNDEYVLPIFDMGRYKKIGDRYQLIDPTLAVAGTSSDTIMGGFKLLYASQFQLRKIQDIHASMQNICGACNGDMQLLSLNCQVCRTEAFNVQQLVQMGADQVKQIRYNPFKCGECGCEENLMSIKQCGSCGEDVSKSVFDSVVYAVRNKVQTKERDEHGRPKTKTEYSYNEAPQLQRPELTADEIGEFFKKVAIEVSKRDSIVKQSEKLNVPRPGEWKTELEGDPGSSRPYGQS